VSSRAGCLAESSAFSDWRRVGPAVKDDEYSGVEAEPVEVAVKLSKSLGQRVGFAGAPDFQFDSFALPGACAAGVGVGPTDQEVDATTANTVFPLNLSAAVDDPLKEGHEHQLRGGFVVNNPTGKHVGVFAPEPGELAQ
jgi:hypothetical protein